MNKPLLTSHVRGMTLVELLIALAIFVVIIVTVGTFEVDIFSYQRSVSASLETAQDAQVILRTMLTSIREASPGANGAYPLISAATSSVSFFSDINNDGTTEQVTYTLKGNTMYQAVIKASGSPPSYPVANSSTSTLVTNVRNSVATPIFQYYDENYTGTSSPLSMPVTTTNVHLIKISLTLDVDPNHSPLPITYTTEAALRNLKTNL